MKEKIYSRVYVEITNICNMSCSFCHGHSRPKKRMTEEEFNIVLNKLSDKTQFIYYHLMGEPLTHPQLPEFISTAKKKGFRSVITTNGTLLKERGEDIIAAGAYKVNISLHSFEENDREGYEKYLREVVSFADRASREGIIVVLRLWNKNFDEGRNTTAFDFLKSKLQGEWAENTRGIRIRHKLHLEWGERFEWPDQDLPPFDRPTFCYGLRDHFGILCDGTVVPCCMDSDGVIALGNIFYQDIDSILSSERAKNILLGFDRKTAVEELCRRCGYAGRFV